MVGLKWPLITIKHTNTNSLAAYLSAWRGCLIYLNFILDMSRSGDLDFPAYELFLRLMENPDIKISPQLSLWWVVR